MESEVVSRHISGPKQLERIAMCFKSGSDLSLTYKRFTDRPSSSEDTDALRGEKPYAPSLELTYSMYALGKVLAT